MPTGPQSEFRRTALAAACPSPSVVILPTQMGDEILAAQKAQRVLQLHHLDEQVMLGIQPGCVHRALEVEREPFLDAFHARPLRQVQEQRHVEYDRRREDAVATEEVHFQLHLVVQPAENVDIVPALFVVSARRIVIDTDDVAKIFVELRIETGLKNVVENRSEEHTSELQSLTSL